MKKYKFEVLIEVPKDSDIHLLDVSTRNYRNMVELCEDSAKCIGHSFKEVKEEEEAPW